MTDYYSTHTLESIARYALKQHDQYFFNFAPQAVPIERIVEDTYGLAIDYMCLSESGNLLGRMVYDDGYIPCFNPETGKKEYAKVYRGTIVIEAVLLENPKYYGRYRFTLAHELAHWIIHKNLFMGAETTAALYKTDSREKNAVEWQANCFAADILMPLGMVKKAFYNLKQTRTGNAEIIKSLSKTFEVSRQAMRIRLEELGLTD